LEDGGENSGNCNLDFLVNLEDLLEDVETSDTAADDFLFLNDTGFGKELAEVTFRDEELVVVLRETESIQDVVLFESFCFF